MTDIVVTSRSFSAHPVLRAELLARHTDVKFNDAGKSLAGEELTEFLRGHPRAITALEKLTDDLFRAVPELKVVSKYGVGLDMVDIAAMQRHGIKLGWTGGVNKRAVSELVIAMAISLLRHVPAGNAEVRAGQWRQLKGREISGRTVGIVGCGNIGKEIVPLLNSFGCRCLAHDTIDYAEFYAANNVEAVDLETLLGASDIVTLHLPLYDATRNIISAERLALMREDAVLINCARGGLVDEDALYRALTDGRLAAAGVDVFSVEPPECPDLIALPNFLATPHIGGSSEEAILAMGRAAIAGLDTAEVPDPEIFKGL